jgi:hypothetical protein
VPIGVLVQIVEPEFRKLSASDFFLQITDGLAQQRVCVRNIPILEVILVDLDLVQFELLVFLIHYEKAVSLS